MVLLIYRAQLSAPLHLSITKLGHRRSSRNHRREEGGGGVTSFQDNVDLFPGGDAMLNSLTRLQSLQETLQQQLEVSNYLSSSCVSVHVCYLR